LAVGLSPGRLIARPSIAATGSSGKKGFSQLPPGFAYLNNGTEGSMPDCVLEVFQKGLERWARSPTTSYETDPVFGKRQELNRTKAGEFLKVGKNNVCLTDNTTMGLSMVLMGLRFDPSEVVVTTKHEHNAIRSPLQVLRARNGIRVEERSFPSTSSLRDMSASQILDALFPDTPALRGAKALCVSHVYPGTGVRLPLRAVRQKADELGIRYLVVDGAQAIGMVDVTAGGDDLRNCDFYACAGHKWLNGPPSTGILYVRDADIRPPEFYPTLSQRMGKYLGGNDQSARGFPMAEALQVRGCSNVPGFAGMIRAFEYANEEGGPGKVAQHILGLSSRVRDFILARAPHSLLSPYAEADLRSGFTVFLPFRWDQPSRVFRDRKTADHVVAELLKRRVQVRSIDFPDSEPKGSSGPQGGGSREISAIRVSTGYFNTVEQVELFTSALEEVLMDLAVA